MSLDTLSIQEFDGCRFFCGDNNKIERELKKGRNFLGEYHYDFTNFAVVKSLVSPGHVCLDIGANIGVYSNVFSHLSGDAANVHAFEPVRHIRHKLLANAKLNGHSGLNVNDFALGDAESRMTMFQIKAGHIRGGVSSLLQNDTYKQLGAENYDEVEVVVTLLDSYVEQRDLKSVDFIKIDVEGFEMNVLRGGRKTVERFRPFVLLELDFERHGEAVGKEMGEYFASLGYQAFEPETTKRTPFSGRALSFAPYDFKQSPRRRNILLVP
ncbi:FkbM family methyltransferase [Ensifer sp.]|jgi:FkbM family methyltransferase|uniref:FkbM family methyltransferase n=1 Tax=Ensifer sp. TaxID=1872086 RepID=UPI002E12AE5E|nr:FkbM family methyltransferase [Ensifer sp.]